MSPEFHKRMTSYTTAIKEIIKFKKIFDPINPALPRRLVGELGEYYVLRKLKKLRFKGAEHKGGYAGYDIYLHDIGKRIEVRTSLLKNEGTYPKDVKFFGWRVKNRSQKKDTIKFDFLVGVALKASFKKPKFFIFTHKEAFSVSDINIGRFKSVQKKIHLFKDKKALIKAITSKPGLVTRYEKYINRHQAKFLDRWDKVTSDK